MPLRRTTMNENAGTVHLCGRFSGTVMSRRSCYFHQKSQDWRGSVELGGLDHGVSFAVPTKPKSTVKEPADGDADRGDQPTLVG